MAVGFLAAPGAGARKPTTVVAPRTPLGRRSGERGNPAVDEAKTVASKPQIQIHTADGLVRCVAIQKSHRRTKKRTVPAEEMLSDPEATTACSGLPIVKDDGPPPVVATGFDRAAKCGEEARLKKPLPGNAWGMEKSRTSKT